MRIGGEKEGRMKKNILICFIGIDGSGKSTFSRYLFEELMKRNYNVSYTWWLEGEDSLLRRLLRRIGKSKYSNLESDANNSNTMSRGGSMITKISQILYPRVVLLDYLRFGVVKVWIPKIMGREKIIIFDRFVYDVVLAISKEFDFTDFRRASLFKIYSRLLPNPGLIFIIDVPPEVSYLRKKDEIDSMENAKAMWARYQELYPLLTGLTSGKIMRIDNTREIEIVKVEILHAVLEYLKGKKDGE
jgi:thymidylate kinase